MTGHARSDPPARAGRPACARRPGARGRGAGELSPSTMMTLFVGAAIAYLVGGAAVAAIAATAGWDGGRWLALHLVLLGGVSQLVLGASQFFVGAFLATRPPPRRLVAAQLLCWNAGTLAVAAWTGGTLTLAVGHLVAASWVAGAGWALLLTAALLLATNLVASVRASQRPLQLPALMLLAGHGMLVIGIGLALATALALTLHAPLLGQQRAPLAALLLAGWLGLTVLGSLLHLLAVLARIRAGRPVPAPSPGRDRLLAGLAAGSLLALAIALGLPVDTPAVIPGAVVVLLATLAAARILVLARAAILVGRTPEHAGRLP